MLEEARNCDIEIVLTNTLSDSTFKSVRIEGGTTDAVSMFFRNEQKKALKLSRPPLTVIIGNPPCSDSANISNEGKLIVDNIWQGDEYSNTEDYLTDAELDRIILTAIQMLLCTLQKMQPKQN